MVKYTEQQLTLHKQQIQDGEGIKRITRMQEWKNNIVPVVLRLKDEITQRGYSGLDPVTGDKVAIMDAAAKANCMVATIDILLQRLQYIMELGEDSKVKLKESDNIPPQERGMPD